MKAGSRRALFQPFLLFLVAAALGLPLFYFNSSTQAQAPKDAAPLRVDPPLTPSPKVSKVESTRPVPSSSGALRISSRMPRSAPNADRIPFDRAVAARIKADVSALSAFPSRMPGTPDYGRAASWVEKRFRESGLQKVRYEEFNVTVPRTLKCELKINGQNVKLLPVYPNGVVPACTPEAGLTAPLIYAGEGRARDFNGQVVKDSIVALDFNSGMNWMTAADLGARAVIFLQPQGLGTRGEAEAKFSNMPVEFPRFYAPQASAQRILAQAGTATKKGATANLLSLVKWERVKGRNIVGEIKGNDAARAQKPGDTLVINAYYDSMSIVPDLAPGAEAAGNLAALLEIARTYSNKPQPYSLTFVANGAHHLALAGTRHFLAKHFLEKKDGPTKKDKDGKDIKEPAFYRGFIGLDLSSRTATVGLFAKSAFYNQMGAGSENILLNQFADFAKQLNDWVDEEAIKRQVRPETFYVDGVTGKDGRSWRSYLPSPVALDSEAATMAQKAGVSFVTANDVRSLQDTPFDLPQYVNADNLARQVGTILFVMNKAFGPLPKEKVTKEKTIGVDLLPESSLFSQNFGYAIGRAIYRDMTTGTSFLPDTPIPDENIPVPAAILTPETEKEMLAEIARLQGSNPEAAKEVQLRLDRRRARQKNQEESRAALRGTVAVAQVLNRWTDLKSYSSVRGAFVERAEFSEGRSLAEAKIEGKQSVEPPVAQFVFVGPRVGDPKGGGTPDAEIETYSVNSAGRVIYARDLGSEKDRFNPRFKKTNQTLNYADEKNNKYAVDATSLCFECRGTALHDTLDQRYFSVLSEMIVLDAQTDAPPTEFGFLASAGLGAWREPIAVVFARPNERFKLIMAQGLLGKRLVVLHTQPRSETELAALAETGSEGKRVSNVQERAVYPEGNGTFVPEDDQLPNPMIYVANQTARDLWSLDQQRIGLLKRFGITNERVDTLHRMAGGDGKDEKGNVLSETTPNGGALALATKALGDLKYDEFYLQSRRAFGFESRAYPDVEATSQDVLKGIVFYLALLLPFSFFLERLLFGFPDVRKQIFGTGAAFLIIFIGIRYVHPAFELALTPFIILLAFIILSLTVVVTSFLSGKFEAEIKRLKQGVHFADVGRLSALSAAFGLGIANMRRRPTRTALTCVTLVLLTFTVLSFTSVTANITNFAKVWAPENTPRYQGVLVRSPDWGPLQQAAVTSMTNEFRQKFETLARRAWYMSPNQGEALYLRVNNAEKPEKFFHAPALLGLTPEEKDIGSPIANTIIKGRWFQKDGRRDVCIVPRAMLLPPKPKEEKADAEPPKIPEDKGPPLGLTPDNAIGQKIQVAGQHFEIIGVFDNNVWFPDQESVKAGKRPLYDIDGEEFTPVDYSNDQNKTAQQNNQLAGQKGEEVQVQRYQHMDANAMLLLPYESVIDMGGSTRSLAAGFTDMKAGQEQLTDMMNRAALGIFGTDTDEKSGKLVAKLYSSVESAGYEGFAALVVPILIAALIIANTMLGSVYERTREIGIYSAVGLAPIHVAALFIAEAFVYAVLGSISGYLVAQAVAKILTTYNLFPGITLNYSSSSAVIATLIVMATVLLSTLYPAWAASRMSQPDIERKWRLNPPIGDLWRLQFPFTVSGQQPMGVAQFLSDFFETHTDTSVGKFYTDKVFFTSLPLREAVALLNEGLPLGGTPADGTNGVHEAKGAETNGKGAKPNGKKNGKTDGPEVAAPSVMLLNLSNIAADPDQEVYRLSMRIWLAPFDMGVSQDADIVLLPSPEAGLYELQLRLWRQSGEIAAWQRVNRGFLSDLRKQLLLWRTIPREAQQEYILRGRAHVRGEQVPLEEPGALVGSGTAG